MANKKFPSECNPRGVVKPLDKVLIYNSDTGASDEFATVSQLTKIQDDAIDALDTAKVDKVEGKSLILDTEIARLADVTNQTLDGLGGEATANKKSTINESDTEFPTSKAVFDGLGLKLDKSSVKNELGDSEELVMSQKGVKDKIKLPVENGEQAAAAALVELKKEVAYLKEVLSNVITYLQINTLSVDSLQIKGAPLFIFSDVVPAVIPDFAGQIYIKTTATSAAWIALGDSSVANWKEI